MIQLIYKYQTLKNSKHPLSWSHNLMCNLQTWTLEVLLVKNAVWFSEGNCNCCDSAARLLL